MYRKFKIALSTAVGTIFRKTNYYRHTLKKYKKVVYQEESESEPEFEEEEQEESESELIEKK